MHMNTLTVKRLDQEKTNLPVRQNMMSKWKSTKKEIKFNRKGYAGWRSQQSSIGVHLIFLDIFVSFAQRLLWKSAFLQKGASSFFLLWRQVSQDQFFFVILPSLHSALNFSRISSPSNVCIFWYTAWQIVFLFSSINDDLQWFTGICVALTNSCKVSECCPSKRQNLISSVTHGFVYVEKVEISRLYWT